MLQLVICTKHNFGEILETTIPNTPWCFIGDFNSIISFDEYKGSQIPARKPMNNFFNWSDSNYFIHLSTLGNNYTWNNGRKGMNLIGKKDSQSNL